MLGTIGIIGTVASGTVGFVRWGRKAEQAQQAVYQTFEAAGYISNAHEMPVSKPTTRIAFSGDALKLVRKSLAKRNGNERSDDRRSYIPYHSNTVTLHTEQLHSWAGSQGPTGEDPITSLRHVIDQQVEASRMDRWSKGLLIGAGVCLVVTVGTVFFT